MKRESTDVEIPLDEDTIKSADEYSTPDKGVEQGPAEYVLIADLKVVDTEYKAGTTVTLTPRQAVFAKGQKCIK